MITISTQKALNGVTIIEYQNVRLLSTDTKPTVGINNGSICIEIDTGKKFMFDAEAETWDEVGSGLIVDANGVDF